jgi:hypothetical protein
LLLAMLGGAAGLLVAYWSTTLLVQSMSRIAPIDVVYDATPDIRVLGFTMLFCVLSTVVFGLLPAWKLSRPDVWTDLKENTGEDGAGRRRYAAQGGALALKNALYQRQPLIVVQGNSRGPKPTLAVVCWFSVKWREGALR